MDIMPGMVRIGRQVQRFRIRKALRQEDLANKAGIGKNTVYRIEHNLTEPHMTTIRKLADALDVEPEELIGEDAPSLFEAG